MAGRGFNPAVKQGKKKRGFSPWGRKPQRLKPEIGGKADVRVKTLTRQEALSACLR